MDENYKPTNSDEAIAYLIEECGEVLQAAGKCLRFGYTNWNPNIPVKITNREQLLEELLDLENAIRIVKSLVIY